MSKHTLFVCKSCCANSDQASTSAQASPPSPSDGTQLLNQLKTRHQSWTHQADLDIREVGCLWTCSQPCSVAFCSSNKATYLFTQVPIAEADALLKFGELYLHSQDGTIPYKQLPAALQSVEIAKGSANKKGTG
ncbi:MAG: DUF1636 domain-containing protein [Phormidesmis sp.]